MEKSSVPTTRNLLWDDSIEVVCFGAGTGNWAMRGMTEEENEGFNPGIAGRLRALIGCYRVNRLYLPSPSRFNGEVAQPDDLDIRWACGTIFRGAHAEGVTMEKIGEAVGIASSDCPTIIARNPSSLLAVSAHAGRESLYDQAALLDGAAPRRHESVTSAIMEKLASKNSDFGNLQLFVVCGIRNTCFSHPSGPDAKGMRNAEMLRHLRERWGDACVSGDGMGRLDLHEIIRRQFESRGVPRTRFSEDWRDTFEDMSLSKGYDWHSHRREKDGKRNLVLAIRRK